MANRPETIAAAGNTEVPAYLTLQSLGFTVTRETGSEGDEWWIATSPSLRVVADSPLELLGLIAMRRERGLDWRASDEAIDSFLATFYPEALER